jgi:hypothetical protein
MEIGQGPFWGLAPKEKRLLIRENDEKIVGARES